MKTFEELWKESYDIEYGMVTYRDRAEWIAKRIHDQACEAQRKLCAKASVQTIQESDYQTPQHRIINAPAPELK